MLVLEFPGNLAEFFKKLIKGNHAKNPDFVTFFHPEIFCFVLAKRRASFMFRPEDFFSERHKKSLI